MIKVYKLFRGYWILFEKREYLINYLAGHNRTDGYVYYNSILDLVGVNDGDTYSTREYKYIGDELKIIYNKENRPYRIYDCNNISMYNKDFINEVLESEYSLDIHNEWVRSSYNKKNKVNIRAEFRKDPVPCRRGKRKRRCLRRMRTYQEIRETSYKEVEGFTRKSRGKKLPTVWDDMVRHIEKNWKSQGKYKKQWEKKQLQRDIRKYGRVYVIKEDKECEAYDDYLEDIV